MKRSTIIRGFIITLLLAMLWPLAAWSAAEALIVRAESSNADALVVLAGSATYLERTHHAAQLFKAGRAPVIVLTNDNVRSGWSAAQQRNPLFVERATEELTKQGVPADKIEIVPGVVWNTYDEITHVRDYAQARGWKSILVVTSAYQSRRVRWTLQRTFAGRDMVGALDPAPTGEQSPPTITWWWHRLGWKLIPAEYAKIIYYRIKY
jgi:uncharacterized SAM-binding protein YcdF (DUF218 family)